jgi:hypothetical protein
MRALSVRPGKRIRVSDKQNKFVETKDYSLFFSSVQFVKKKGICQQK